MPDQGGAFSNVWFIVIVCNKARKDSLSGGNWMKVKIVEELYSSDLGSQGNPMSAY